MPKNTEQNWIIALRNFRDQISPNTTFSPEDGLDYWREQIFMRIIIAIVFGAIFVVGFLSILSISQEYWVILIFDLVAFFAAVIATFIKGIKLRTRVHIFMVITFSLGLTLQLRGPLVNGGLILFVFPILAAILLGPSEAILALGLNFITSIVISILLFYGVLEGTPMEDFILKDWIGNSIGNLFFNALVTFSLSILLEGLADSFYRVQKTQSALQESQARYQAIIEDQIELIDRWEPDGTLIFVNQAAADYVGVPRDELIGQNFYDFLSENDQAYLKTCLNTLTPANPVFSLEEQVTIQNKVRWMRWTNRALFNEKGSICEFQSVGRDITKRKLAEEKLAHSESHYRAIVEDQIELLDRWKPDGTLTFVNQALADFAGMTREELLGKNVYDFYSPEAQRASKEKHRSLTPENPHFTTDELVTINGKTRWIRWVIKALFDSDGAIQEFQAVGRDITESKRVDEELKRSERRYRAIVETQKEIISRWLPDGNITFINDAGCRFYNQSSEELLQTNIIDLAPADEKQKLRDYIASFSMDTPSQSILLSGPDKQGVTHWFEWHDNAIIEDGRIVEFQSIGRDITDEKHMQDELQKSEARYRAVVEDQLELICRLLPDGTITFTNHAYARFFGKQPEDIIGGNLYDVVAYEEANFLIKKFKELTPAQPILMNTQMETNTNGEKRWHNWTNRGLFDKHGNLLEIQAIGQDIHEQKLTEQALQKSETRYRAVVEDQLEMICRATPAGTYTFVNDAYARFYGYQPEELLQMNFKDLLDADLVVHIRADYKKISPEQPMVQRTNQSVNARGETRWCTWTDRGIFDEDKNLIEIQAIGRDIHEQKLAEQALQKSEARYRAIIENQVELVCRFLADGTLTFVNHAFAKFFGWKPETLIGKNLNRVVEKEAVDHLLENCNLLGPENPVFPNTHLATNTNQEKRWFTWTNSAIFDSDGNLVEFQALGQDIHDRKLAEQALEESEARYRAIVQNQIEPVCRWTPDYHLTFVNDAYCKLFNRKREELLGTSFIHTIPEEDWMIVEQMTLDLKTGTSYRVDENRVITADGVRWMQWALSSIEAENGKIIEFQSVGHDITEQKNVQQMLEKSLTDQIKLSKDNSELAKRLEGLYLTDVDRHEAQLGHLAIELHDDVLNALAVVSTNLDPDETPKHVIQAYERAIQRTREIVNGLRTAMLNYGLYIGLETLADELSDQLPDGPIIYVDVSPSTVRYDSNVELHLFRIVQEACNNAIKHANASEIHISGDLGLDAAFLEIWDNGTGFDTQEILDLPDLLREQHFGLAGMFERAELIHGELRILSTPNEGSKVRVSWQALLD